MNCPNCGVDMPKVFENGHEAQVKGGLTIELHGYYGGFFDQFYNSPAVSETICHDCAAWLAREFPVFARMLAPFESGAHPGEHCCPYGW